MAGTPRYAFPLLEAGQAQKEITHNEAVARTNTLLHLAAESRHVIAPPATEGVAWIVGAGATGDWAGRDGMIAASDDAGWDFIAPRDGCIAFVRDEGIFVHYANGTWRDGWTVPSLTIGGRTVLGAIVASIPAPAGGGVADLEVRATVALVLSALRAQGIIAA